MRKLPSADQRSDSPGAQSRPPNSVRTRSSASGTRSGQQCAAVRTRVRTELAAAHGLRRGRVRSRPAGSPGGVAAPASVSPARPAVVEPLSPARYKVQFTACAELRDKLERLAALMRSEVPDGDLAAIIEQAVTEKLERLEARRFATDPRSPEGPRRHRHVPDVAPHPGRRPASGARARRRPLPLRGRAGSTLLRARPARVPPPAPVRPWGRPQSRQPSRSCAEPTTATWPSTTTAARRSADTAARRCQPQTARTGTSRQLIPAACPPAACLLAACLLAACPPPRGRRRPQAIVDNPAGRRSASPPSRRSFDRRAVTRLSRPAAYSPRPAPQSETGEITDATTLHVDRLQLLLAAAGKAVADPVFVNGLRLRGSRVDATGQPGPNEGRLGFFSDLYYDPKREEWWALSDRGPGGGVMDYQTRVQKISLDVNPWTGAHLPLPGGADDQAHRPARPAVASRRRRAQAAGAQRPQPVPAERRRERARPQLRPRGLRDRPADRPLHRGRRVRSVRLRVRPQGPARLRLRDPGRT